MLTQPLTVPDMNTGLTTSSVILAKALDPAPEQLTGQQQLEQPFTISGYKVVPSFGAPIPQSGELMFVFFIYNEGVAASGKPDLDVEYLFYRANEEKPFTKLATQSFNATTLPGQFDLNVGPPGVRRPGDSGEGCVRAGRLSAGDQGDRQDQQSDDYAERSVHRVVSVCRPRPALGGGLMTRWIPAAAIATFVLGAPAAYAQTPPRTPDPAATHSRPAASKAGCSTTAESCRRRDGLGGRPNDGRGHDRPRRPVHAARASVTVPTS